MNLEEKAISLCVESCEALRVCAVFSRTGLCSAKELEKNLGSMAAQIRRENPDVTEFWACIIYKP
jgi:hypothetical protein